MPLLDYVTQANQTKIVVCAAINIRRFRGNPNVPSDRSHIIVQGYFDEYLLDPDTKQLTRLTVIVESFEIQHGPCASGQDAHRCNTLSLPSTPLSLSSSFKDNFDYQDSEVDTYNPFPP
jgi:hypothetical protein